MLTHRNVNTHDITVFRMHEISCEELRWFVLVSTAKLQYNPKNNVAQVRKKKLLPAADCGLLELLSWKPVYCLKRSEDLVENFSGYI